MIPWLLEKLLADINSGPSNGGMQFEALLITISVISGSEVQKVATASKCQSITGSI
jgi:hypothetical protein